MKLIESIQNTIRLALSKTGTSWQDPELPGVSYQRLFDQDGNAIGIRTTRLLAPSGAIIEENQSSPPITWDVSEEENNRVNLPANDCRRFNGGQIASPQQQRLWSKPNQLPIKINPGPIFINRLRDD